MSDDTGNGSKEKKPSSAVLKVQDVPLTIREHLDPDKHWIGETLAPPTQGEIEALVGAAAGPGESPFVARADHKHKLDPTAVTAITNNYYTNTWAYTIPPVGAGVNLSAGAQFVLGSVNVPIPAGWGSIVVVVLVVGIATTVAGQVAVQTQSYIPGSAQSGDFADTCEVGNNQIVAIHTFAATPGTTISCTGIARALGGTHSVINGRAQGFAIRMASGSA